MYDRMSISEEPAKSRYLFLEPPFSNPGYRPAYTCQGIATYVLLPPHNSSSPLSKFPSTEDIMTLIHSYNVIHT